MVEVIYKNGTKEITNIKHLQDIILVYLRSFIFTWKFI
jgi:hypothetical protein